MPFAFSLEGLLRPGASDMPRPRCLLLLLLLLALLAWQHPALGLIAAETYVYSPTPEKKCPEGKGLFEEVCCDFCPPGMVVDRCTQTNRVCKFCTKGEEYMDHLNLNLKCRRCSLCDTEHGMEVEENCTIYQNIKCRCKPDFFCHSEQCQHCDRCTKCEEGTVEECTQTKDAVCKRKGNLLWLCTLFLIPMAAFVWYCYRCKRSKKEYSVHRHQVGEEHIDIEEHFPDIDLNPHIPDIATEMTKEQVLMLVRKLEIEQGVIDIVTEDNVRNTAELKIGLLQKWYEQNGMRGAYKKLIITLRLLKFCRVADKIEQKLNTRQIGDETQQVLIKT